MRFWIFILFHPNYWIMTPKYNEEWDKYVNDCLDEGFPLIDSTLYKLNASLGICNTKTDISDKTSTIIINDKIVWITNYPYHYCTEHNTNFRPSRKTILRFNKYLTNHKIIHPEYYL